MERLRCVVERITYQNEQNGYSVIKVKTGGYTDLVTVVGNMPEVHVGSVLEVTGSWKVDAKYGRQFAMEAFEETLPATVYGIEKYLGSGLVKGIGPKYARAIVRTFGAETLNIIDDEPLRLREVPGIGEIRAEWIRKSWEDQKEIKNIMVFLQGHNVSTGHATRIYKTYGNESIQVVQENPYRLADDIWGIGFKTADTIAEKMGFEHERYERLRGGLLYTLNQLADDGHCFATRAQLVKAGMEILSVHEPLITAALDRMILEEDVKTEPAATPEDTPVYLPPFWFAEQGCARRLNRIAGCPYRIQVPGEGLEERISALTGMQYDEVQMEAIRLASEKKVSILTGGPGTGKTTTTLGIIRAFQTAGARILLAAPTGRAAKRLSETTGMEAKTIHRLLEVKPPEGYQRNEENPLEGDVLIVDECSMIDLLLMYNLLKAVPDAMTLVFVGDVDQLPSVGAGNVLRDLIDSGVFPVVRLTRIFRQAQSSRIILNAHRINQGIMPDLSNGRDTDFFFIEKEDPEAVAGEIVNLVKNRLPKFYGVPSSGIQVLTPMQRGAAGATNLNQVLQQAVNPGEGGLRRGGFCFREQDKVMQIRNNYDKEVFNGDIGTILSVNEEERELTALFDGREILYDVSELDELVLAYATTIHKSQGSEYPIVVMPILMSHFVMLQRNLVYTGVTRAKKILVIVGTKKALGMAVRTVKVSERNTLLAERLSGKMVEAPTLGAQLRAVDCSRFVCFDVETPNARNDRMSAIGISVVENGCVTEEFFSYVNPEEPFDDFNTQLTGISPETVADAPTFRELWPRILPLMSGGTLVAHNAPFDLGVLKKCLQDYGIAWKDRVAYLCTVQIGRKILPAISHRLNDMCRYYQIELDHHKADSDSRACAEILIRYMQSGVDPEEHRKTWWMK